MTDHTRQLYAGRVTGKGTLETSEGELFLSGARAGHKGSLRSLTFASAREREGQYVIIKAARRGKALWLCEMVEAAEPLTSRLIDRLLEDMPALRAELLALVRGLRDETVGVRPDPPDPSDPLARSISSPKPICALVVGHRRGAKGAQGELDGSRITEWDYNRKLAEDIAGRCELAEVLVIYRDDTRDGYAKLPAKINALLPKFVVSLHANAADGVAGGTETLYFHTSAEGKKLAGVVQKHLVQAMGLADRGSKRRRSADRGGTLLAGTWAPAVIAEPFFIDNPRDLKRAVARQGRLAKAYAEAIDAYAALISVGAVRRAPAARGRGSRSSGRSAVRGRSLVAGDRGKRRFLKENRGALLQMIEATNGILVREYGDAAVPLTQTDFWVLFNSEAGLRPGGKIDVDHRHSEGERGLLPLPSNIRFWNGPGAPAWDRPMALERNIEHFMRYLGQLKNKHVREEGGFVFYRGAFQRAAIRGHVLREARVLSGIVHGYLYFGNFSDREVPVERILRGFANDRPIPAIMDGTTYRHAGTAILANREKNIREAIAMV